nr:reverse transcriptase domain-containing protein [Tanacetum cinerariifolium]
MEKVRNDRRKDVHTRLDFGEGPRESVREDSYSNTRATATEPERRRDSRYSPRGRGHTRNLSAPRDDRHKDRECLHDTRESYGDSFYHSYCDEGHHRHMKRKRNKSPPSSVLRSDSSNERHRKVNNPELTKRLNEHVSKTMEEMMIATTAFIRGETTAASKKKGHASWKPQDQSKRYSLDKRLDFRGHSRGERGSNPFTPLTKTPKEILATEASKFRPPPPIVTPVEKRSSNKFCDFHNDKGYSTDECMQLKKQIEELVRAGKLSHLIK